MKVSFWKTQCSDVIVAAFYFVLSLVNLFLENDFACLLYLISAFAWLLTAVICYNCDCIKKLEERVEALENRAITDIDKVFENNFMVRRRLGPDKDVPYPDED